MSASERLGVIGDPIAHSLSPAMHAAALEAAGLDWTYEAHRVAGPDLPEWWLTVGRRLRGFNVTIPHKTAVSALVDDVDTVCHATGAVNTVLRAGHRTRGYNTDPVGFLCALSEAGFNPFGANVLVFGAGGAARGVVHALEPLARRIVVANRSVESAQRLRGERLEAVSLDDASLPARVRQADLLVNATPMGMRHLADVSPLPQGATIRSETFVSDLVYGHDTPLLRTARRCGCVVQDGLEMLIQQGAESFRLWTGVEPDIAAMRRACRDRMEILSC